MDMSNNKNWLEMEKALKDSVLKQVQKQNPESLSLSKVEF